MANQIQESDLHNTPKTQIQFMNLINKDILAFVQCDCGYASFLITDVCPKCKGNTRWKIITSHGTGKIVSYCVVYVGPPELMDITPYISVIVDFGAGLRISAILSMKFDMNNPPMDLIGKSVSVKCLERPNRKILGVELVQR